MQILFNVLTGTKDATRASIPLHLAVNGSLEVGDQPVVLLAGDGTEYLVGDAIDHAEGVGLPTFRDLVAKLREHEVRYMSERAARTPVGCPRPISRRSAAATRPLLRRRECSPSPTE
jgi:hypothetical protein